MNADEFARLCRAEKDSLVRTYFDATEETAVGSRIRSLSLSDEECGVLREIVNGVLTDAWYTLLLAIDGAASLDGVQQDYDLRDETGDRISGDGELEAAAYVHFQDSDA
ncbi:hypothetical protein [Novipirellula caenicola]|uniref:Uncharacterized protein n=1 Tax=Novipirellula caenicola TaxID=1536901 RepID=A0ABP9VYQ2_9BACT